MACPTPAGIILVVEDAEAVRKLVCALLAQSGYNCLEASDGAEAMVLVEGRVHELGLVVTDVVMPRMNGSELAKRLSMLRPELPVLFMSGYADDMFLEAAGKTALPFLSKPFTSEALIHAVRHALGVPRAAGPSGSES